MMAHPMLTQKVLPLKHPRNLLWCKTMSFTELWAPLQLQWNRLFHQKKKNGKSQGEDVENTFGKLFFEQLNLILEWNLKDYLKINIQQMVLRCKRQVNSSNSARQGHLPSTYQLHCNKVHLLRNKIQCLHLYPWSLHFQVWVPNKVIVIHLVHLDTEKWLNFIVLYIFLMIKNT